MRNKKLLSIIMAMMLCIVMVTGTVFAEGELPGTESGTEAVQASEQGTAVQPDGSADVEQPAATEPDETANIDDEDEDDEDPDEIPDDPTVRTIQKKKKNFTWTDLTIKINSYDVVTSQPLDADKGPLQTKINAAKTSITVSWDAAKDPAIDGYILLKAGKDKKYAQLAVLGSDVTSYTDKKAKKKNTAYYYTVVSYVKDGSEIRISECANWAAGETSNSKLKNAYSATLDKTAVTLQNGGTATIKMTIADASKKFLGTSKRYESDNEDIAIVSDSGDITATGVGTTTVRGIIASGNSVDCTVTVVGAFKPAATQLYLVCATPSSIELQWKKAQYATHFEVYCQKEENGPFELLTTTDKLSYVHEGLEADHVYRYYVKTVNNNLGAVAKGDESNILEQAAVDRPRTFSIPEASAKLTYGGSDNGVTISWTMLDATGVSSYEILRGTTNNVEAMTVIGKADADALKYVYVQNPNGTYYYAVRALGGDSDEPKTSEPTGKVTVAAKGILAFKSLVWRGTVKSNISIYKESGLHNKVASVKKGTVVKCIDKYPASVAKFHTPSKVKVKLSDGTVGWLKYSQLKGGVKAAINLKNDYTRSVKEDYVNSMGFTSKTGYLVWVSPYTQRAYTFTGSAGNWKLLRSDRVTTGRFSHMTAQLNENNRTSKRGQIYKRKGRANMVTEEGRKYFFRYASYFSPGVSMHTGTWWTDTGKRRGSVTSKPNTWGCVRMYDSAAKWVYKNVPKGSSVVVMSYDI